MPCIFLLPCPIAYLSNQWWFKHLEDNEKNNKLRHLTYVPSIWSFISWTTHTFLCIYHQVTYFFDIAISNLFYLFYKTQSWSRSCEIARPRPILIITNSNYYVCIYLMFTLICQLIIYYELKYCIIVIKLIFLIIKLK